MSRIPKEKLSAILDRYAQIEHDLSAVDGGSDEYVELTREYSQLATAVVVIKKYLSAVKELEELEGLLKDDNNDLEVQDLAKFELLELEPHLKQLESDVRVHLLPKDEADERNAILEVRAGTGGEEAGLFASELFRMYQRYSETKGWKFEPLSFSEKEHGGIKEAQALVSGPGVFARLKYESGVHRVQRVPETESSGRIHTSAATVAVLPEAEEVDVQIEEKDLRVDVYRASGPGGQSVNTTDSAVRITHLPTGIVVTQQDEKSQHKNRAKAMKILLARLFDREREEAEAARAAQRRGQVGSGDRSERVRTYNFPQGRVTDHRINLTLHKLAQVMAGEALDDLVNVLISEDQASQLSALES